MTAVIDMTASAARAAERHRQEGKGPHEGAEATPIRVCFVSPLGGGLYRADRGYAGGAELQFFHLSQSLSHDRQFHVSVLVTETGAPTVDASGAVKVFSRQGKSRLAQVAPSIGAWTGMLRQSVEAFREMGALFRTIDADVFLHAGAGVEVGAYALLCRLMGKRFVFVVASSADLRSLCGSVRGPLRWLYPIGVYLAHAVICRTEEQQEWLRRRYRREGILIRTAHPSEPDCLRPVGRVDAPSILWAGRLDKVKQPEIFLELARSFPMERFAMLVIHGDGQAGEMARLRQQVKELPNVTLAENLPWHQTGRWFAAAKLFVNTSAYEGFPNTFVQAAMYGTPILSLGVDPDGVLSRFEIGACAAGSIDRLKHLVTRFCASDGLRAEYGARARAYAKDRHGIDRCTEQLKTLIRSMAG